MNVSLENIFANVPHHLPDERFEELARGGVFRLERIISTGHFTPTGQWYDQDHEEWVLVLRGSARLRFDGEPETVALGPGDYVRIPAHCRHRVEWTDPAEPTVWLALHFEGGGELACGGSEGKAIRQ